jgi:acyl transferase domain-containing protein
MEKIDIPNGEAQIEVICDALRSARLSPNDISFMEAHGSGTPLGDSIEMEAILKVILQLF